MKQTQMNYKKPSPKTTSITKNNNQVFKKNQKRRKMFENTAKILWK